MAIFMQGQGEVAGTTASLHAGPGIHSPEAQREGERARESALEWPGRPIRVPACFNRGGSLQWSQSLSNRRKIPR